MNPLTPIAPPPPLAEAALADLLQRSFMGAVRTDAQGRFLQANDRFCEMLGYPPGGLTGASVESVTFADDLPESIGRVAVLRAGGPGFAFEKRYRHREGRVVHALTNVTALRDENGAFAGMLALVQDIQELKANERRLAFLAELSQRLAGARDEAEVIRITLESLGRQVGAHRCYFVECCEAEDRIVVSPCWSRDGAPDLAGSYGLFEFGGADWWSRYAAGDFAIADVETEPLTRGAAADAYLRLGVRSYAVQPFRSDGPMTVVLAVTDNVARTWTADEKLLLEHVVARAWPLVERARADRRAAAAREDAERQRAFLEALLSVSLDFVSVFDRDHRFVYANRALAEFWGLTPPQVAGMTLGEMGHTEWQVKRHEAEIDRVFRTGKPVRDEVFTGDNAYEYIMVPVAGPDGRVQYVMGLTRDVTENRRAVEEVKRQAVAKDEFIATLAHELRGPLAAVRNGLEILRLGGTDPRTLTEVRPRMERQLVHLLRMVDDLLDASRLGLRKIELRRTRVLLSNLVADAVEAARPPLEAAHHTLQVDLPAEPIYLDADLTRLSQVLGNLLHNSVKYTRPGGHIRIAARRDGEAVEIDVSDNGVGIAAADLERVFQMFAQVPQPGEGPMGLGIGLALVRGLVQMHGGTVRAASPGPGAGTTITVRLPLLVD